MMGVISYSIASIYAHIWEVSCDALLHCYCHDIEVGEKKGQKGAKYASAHLNAVIQEEEKYQGYNKESGSDSYAKASKDGYL